MMVDGVCKKGLDAIGGIIKYKGNIVLSWRIFYWSMSEFWICKYESNVWGTTQIMSIVHYLYMGAQWLTKYHIKSGISAPKFRAD